MDLSQLVELRTGMSKDSGSAFKELIQALKVKAADLPGLLKNIGETELKVTRDRFTSKTAPDGTPWKDNSPLTKLLARGGSLMRRSGRLMGSLNYQVVGDTLQFGPNTVYAAVQQFGAVIMPRAASTLRIPIAAGMMIGGKRTKQAGGIFVKSVTIPARPYIGIGPKDEEAITNTVEDWFTL